MHFMKLFIPLIFLILFTYNLKAQIITEVVEYKYNDTILEGYLAFDKSVEGKRPAIIVFHEWTGINDYIRTRVEQLAGLGYIVFAGDIYGKGVRPSDRKEAGALSSKYKNNIPLMRERAEKAYEYIQNHELSSEDKIAAIGYCFGGFVALELARSGVDLKGVVGIHGNLKTPEPADNDSIKASILILHGALDPYVSDDEVLAFRSSLEEYNKDYQILYYGNAVHAFTNPDSGNDPTKGSAYNEKADRRSYRAMLNFFEEIFQTQ